MTNAVESLSNYDEFGNPALLNDFIRGQNRIHAHLDWRTPLDWLSKPPSLILHRGIHINGMASLAADPPHIHWVRFFCCRKDENYEYIWKKLFSSILQNYPFHKSDLIVALSYQDWMKTLLEKNGWVLVQRVISLEWRGLFSPIHKKETQVHIRKMALDDLPTVAQIDDLSFQSFWKFSPTTLTMAFKQSAYSTIAEIDGKVVGFQISSADLSHAHLVRLAVLPDYRNFQIGTALVQNMLLHFSIPWISQVTVNTQQDNQTSLHLYKQLGFEYCGESYPIFKYPVFS